MINLAVVNNRFSIENGDRLKSGIKELFKINNNYDRIDKNEQSVFGKNKDINVEITENSQNIQRINLNKMKILNYSSKRDIDFKPFTIQIFFKLFSN